jgi:cohesin loading factor subunit SCC2
MYSEIVQATQGCRQRFLTALLKPFDAACNLAASQSAAVREDPARLAFCAYLAANLPFKRGDEPLVLLHVINSYVSRLAQEVRDVLRRALLRLGLRDSMGLEEEDENEGPLFPPSEAAVTPSQQQQDAAAGAAAAGAAEQHVGGAQHATPHGTRNGHHHHHQQPVALPLALPLPQWLAAPLKASMGLSMLLVLKQYLMAAYSLSDERVAQYELKGEKARAEAKAIVSKSKRTGDFGLAVVNLLAVQDGTGELLAAQYKTFAGLLDNDTANYK